MDVMETSGGLYDPKKRYLVYKQPISLDELQVHDITSAPGIFVETEKNLVFFLFSLYFSKNLIFVKLIKVWFLGSVECLFDTKTYPLSPRWL